MTPLPAGLLTHPIAHRALHDRAAGRPENSRAAVQAAVEAGYGIEIDLQLSSDDQAMVFHDDTLERLTQAAGPVSARSAAELGGLLLNDAEDGIPTLTEVLAIVAGRVPLLIEIKDQSHTMSDTTGRLEAATVAALAGYDGPVAVMSFNPHAVAHIARLAPHLPLGLTTCSFDPVDWKIPQAISDRLRDIPDAEPLGVSFLSHHWRDLSRPRVQALKADGLALVTWTIRSREEEAAARALGAQNVTFEGYAAEFPA